MKKLGLLLSASGAMIIAACGVAASHIEDLPERDVRVIVEVDQKLGQLKEENVKATQDAVYANIKKYATTNVKRTQGYNQLNNAFLMEANSDDVESIKSVPGVASVTLDTMHWVREINNDEIIPIDEIKDGEGSTPALGENDNISAATMHKPENTNDGEGTLVAILDNEFHFRGKVSGTAEWHHEVYDPLPDNVAVRYTFNQIKNVSGMNAKTRKLSAKAGDEGSEYLNSKVPFYFDYGGESFEYGKAGTPKYDVHSDLSYHGSHVSSITAANAPDYKGIAPKAQLALMKVFTDYNAKGGTGMGQKLGLSTHTGAYDSCILAALEDCIRLKVDGINMSLGSDLDDFDQDSITLKTLTRLNESGILTSISAGNAGKSSYSSTGAYGNWGTEMVETGILSSYANNAASMTVASGHPIQVFYENAFTMGTNTIAFEDQIVNREGFDDDYQREYRMKDIYEGQPLEWVYIPGFGTSADYAGLNVEGKIAVVNRGSTAFSDKYATAVDKGAIALVIINNDPTASSFNFRCSFGDGFNPSMPCCLVLYKDKPLFETARSGSFGLINNQVNDNPNKYTVSNFSSDGATFDLDLKPEITAPGDNIKGAVPEHAMTNLTKEERESEQYWHKCYQYLSGTSMSAPNYAGAQALVLSEKAGPIYRAAKAANRVPTADEKAEIDAYRATVNMRLMSTADPMKDFSENPETKVKTLTSPRIQGAGMVDLDGAINTEVYLEGLDLAGEKIGKSKVALRNNPDIAKGDIKIKFVAHNESNENKIYNVVMSVLRPALAQPNDIVTKDYNFKGEIESVESLSGMAYFDTDIREMAIASGLYAYKDAYKVSKDIEYYATAEDYAAGKKTIIPQGYYYNAAEEGVNWLPLPSYTAQSTQDTLIDIVSCGVVTVRPGENTVELSTYSLPEDVKAQILDNYEYGCMIEGFITMAAAGNYPDLSIPYLGFYSGTDKNEEASYETAPVAEEFNFEKDQTKVYPSDLVNDIAKSLIGKDNINMESMMVAGYVDKPQSIDKDRILSNDQSFDRLTGFYKVGTDPLTGEYTNTPSDDIYLGNPATTNTLIIQQFMYRSVAENYFTITNKDTHEQIYASVLEDMLFGDSAGKYALYKSHVDANYLAAGYVSHRAYAIVPLYDETTGEAFESGEYELQFNYQLSATGNWISKSYTIHIDSVAPVLKSVTQYRDDSGTERIRAYYEDDRLSYGAIGYNRVNAQYDEERKLYYLDETKEFVNAAIEEISFGETKKLYFGAVDFARGNSGAIAKFKTEGNFAEGLTIVQGDNIQVDYDFTYENGKLTITDASGKIVKPEGKVIVMSVDGVALPVVNPPEEAKGCKSSVVAASAIICVPSLVGTALLLLKKKKGGKK